MSGVRFYRVTIFPVVDYASRCAGRAAEGVEVYAEVVCLELVMWRWY